MKILNIKNKNRVYPEDSRGGYTIIETMIAISLFTIIVTAGVGALLNANLVHNQSSNMRSIVDSLTFIMEDMSRHIRTGYNYRCYDLGNQWSPDYAQFPILNEPQSCALGKVIVFEEAYGEFNASNGDDQWVYLIGSLSGGTDYNIYKSTQGGLNGTFVQLNDSAIRISPESSIAILGAEHPSNPLQNGDIQQPLVTIKIMGEIQYKDIITPFSLQTSVSQRLIDVTP